MVAEVDRNRPFIKTVNMFNNASSYITFNCTQRGSESCVGKNKEQFSMLEYNYRKAFYLQSLLEDLRSMHF